MKIFVKAKPNAKEEKIRKIEETANLFGNNKQTSDTYEVWIKEPPVDGKANEAIAEILVKHFGVSKSQIILISGFSSKQKIFEIFT